MCDVCSSGGLLPPASKAWGRNCFHMCVSVPEGAGGAGNLNHSSLVPGPPPVGGVPMVSGPRFFLGERGRVYPSPGWGRRYSSQVLGQGYPLPSHNQDRVPLPPPPPFTGRICNGQDTARRYASCVFTQEDFLVYMCL